MSDAIGSEYLLAPSSVTATVTSGVSTAAVDALGANAVGGFFDFSVKGADVHILFGNASVAAATTSNAMYVPAGAVRTYYLTQDTRYFRVLATAIVVGQAVLVAKSGP